eukprot:44594-Eustigmatos_ZCMA.PRE.1
MPGYIQSNESHAPTTPAGRCTASLNGTSVPLYMNHVQTKALTRSHHLQAKSTTAITPAECCVQHDVHALRLVARGSDHTIPLH